MEILTNVWNALNTENIFLFRIISIPCSLLEIYLMFKLFTITLKTSYTKKQLYMYIFPVAIVSITCSFCIPEPFNIFINYSFILVLLLKCFHYNILQSIVAIVIPFSIFGLVSSLLTNPFMKLFNVTYNAISAIPIYHFIYLLFVYMIIFLIIFVLKKIKIRK